MAKQFIRLATVMTSLFVGCTNQTSPSAPLPAASIKESVIPVPEILPGNRPKRIGDAKYFSIEAFAGAIDNKELVDGDLISVEGRVKQAGERMGAAYLLFDFHEKHVDCEGGGLRRYDIRPGTNVIVLGKVSKYESHFYIRDASLLSQNDVDAALAAEQD